MTQGRYTVEHEDDTFLHVRHPDGSMMRVAKGGLGAKLIAKIKGEAVKMAEGGPVLQPWEVPVGEGDPTGTGVGHLTDTRETAVQDRAAQLTRESQAAEAARVQQIQAQAQAAQQQAEAASIENEARVRAGMPPLEPAAPAPGPESMAAHQPAYPQLQQPQQFQSAGASGYRPGLGLGSEISGLTKLGEQAAQEKYAATSQQAQELGAIHEQYATDIGKQYQNYQDHIAAVDREYDSAVNDFRNAHIDPQRLWNNRTDFQKVTAALGMVLSGFGSGLSGQSNMAHDILERAIENDINSQKAEMDKKQTLIGQIYQKYGRTDQADNIARLYMAASVEGKAHVIADRAGTLQAAAARDAEIADWRQRFIPIKLQLAQFSLMQQSMQGGGGAHIPGAFGPTAPEGYTLEAFNKARNEDVKRTVAMPALEGAWPEGTPALARDPKMADELSTAMQAQKLAKGYVANLKQLVSNHRLGVGLPVGEAKKEWDRQVGLLTSALPAATGASGALGERTQKVVRDIVGGGWDAALHGPESLQKLEEAVGPDLDQAHYAKLGIRLGKPKEPLARRPKVR